MKPSYYANIPAPVRYDASLTANAKLLYGEITALCNKEGFCWATNDYFAELYETSERTVRRWISGLNDSGHIVVEIDCRQPNKRKIFLKESRTKMSETRTKMSAHEDKNVRTTIYSINNTINTAGSALGFVIKNYPIRFEQEFLMVFEKQFKDQSQFDKFLRDFNNEAEMKERVFGVWLVPFLKKYVENWLSLRKDRAMKVIKELGPTALSKLKVI